MTISIDLNGGASGSDATTAFTEQSIVSLFSSAALSANGGDSNSIDTVTLTLASATGTESLSLNAAASSAATSAGIAVNYNSGTGVLTLSGSNELTSDWQTILRGVQYDNTSDAPTGPRTVTVVANNGVNSSTPRTDTINITAVNDAPVATITPTSYSATEQTSLNLKNTGLSISDVDAGSSSMSVTLSVTEGALNVAAGTSGAVVSNSGTSSVTITGTVAQINALLSTNATSTVSYIDNTDAPGASATLTLNVNDNGNTGGGALQSSDTATINITAVNDAPVATITPTSYSATEQTSLNLKNTGLSISDVDAGSSSVSVTLSVTEGALNVTAGTSGAAVSNSGASSVTITGTVAQINALLSTDAGSAVSYIDNTDAPGASATLTLNVNDNGNTGGGSLQSSDTATINIAAVNDAPVATDDAATLAEGGAVTTLNVLANDSDVDSTLTAASITGFSQGAHGSVVYNNDGTFTYTHDGSETASDSFSYTITDGAGGTTTATVNLTVTPVNDTPVAVADSKAITEDTAPNPVSGNVLTNDTDADMLDTLTVTAVNGQVGNVGVDITGVYGTLHLNGDGSYTYTLDNGLESVQALAGQQVTDVFSYTAADNHGASSSADLTINILGTNDAAVLSADVSDLSETDTAGDISTSGTLTISDVDSPASFVAQAGTAGSYGTFAIDSAGAWTYTASSEHNEFEDGTTYTDTFAVASADGTTTSVTINILGTNDAAVLSADVSNLTETDTAGDISTAGTLTISDVDSPASFVAQAGTAGSYGTFAIDSAGAWTYTANSEHNEFEDGTTYTDTFAVASADGTTTSVTINILGTNDAAVLSADVSNLTETDTAADISTAGTLTISDVDSPASFVAQAGTIGSYGTFAIDSAGAWTYTASSEHNEFEAGTTYTDTFAVASADGTTTSVTINILGTNDAAVLSADVSNLTETDTAADISTAGTLTISDVDSPASFVAQAGTVGSYGTFAIDSAGAWTYTASSAHNEFAAGTTYTDTFAVASADGTTTSVTINILGTNDAAVLSADVRDLSETNAAATSATSGTLTISDVDSPASFVAQAGTVGSYGTFAIDSAGAWTYTASSAHNEFAAGTTYTDTFAVASADGTTTSVTINILGTNDAAVLSADVSNLTETNTAADISTAGTLTISDVDSPASFVAQAGTIGSYGTFAIDTAGAWTYTASSAHNEFEAGTTYTDTFAVASADGTTTSVTINILGTNDAAVLSADVRDLSETNGGRHCHLRHAHRQRRRQPRQLRGAGRHRRQLRHLRHR